jgi:hypothetical protein
MATWVVDVLAIIFAVGLAVLGIWRGFLRELLVSLAGIVLGVFAGSLWATSWGPDWASRFGVNVVVFQGVIGLVSLFLVVLFVGYGSALFLPRRPISFWQRLAGGGVGLLNGLFLAAFTFSYIQSHFLGDPPPADSVLMKSLIASAMIRWLPVVLGGIVLAVALAVLVVACVRLARFISHLVQEPPAAAPAASAAPAAPAPAPAPTPAAGPTVPCPNCGNPVPVGAGFCPQCGKTLTP